MRLRRTIKAGFLALVAATALLALGGLSGGKPAIGVERAAAATGNAAAASPGVEQPGATADAARAKAVPFTALDLLLLGSGAAMLLVSTAAIRRVRDGRAVH